MGPRREVENGPLEASQVLLVMVKSQDSSEFGMGSLCYHILFFKFEMGAFFGMSLDRKSASVVYAPEGFGTYCFICFVCHGWNKRD